MKKKVCLTVFLVFAFIVFCLYLIGLSSPKISSNETQLVGINSEINVKCIATTSSDIVLSTSSSLELLAVVKVVDGDTIDVLIGEKTERIRLIGINTPETVDPRKPVECFGKEASNKAKTLLSGKKVYLESDLTQGDLDKYNRLLRYVFLEDKTNFSLLMVKEGYAYEYTYNVPYKYQTEFKNAQKKAELGKLGLWADGACQSNTVTVTSSSVIVATSSQAVNKASCTIKGNISSTKDKIYHMIGCGSYNKTTIDESKGERWFCTEQEAQAAGWRKALNCN